MDGRPTPDELLLEHIRVVEKVRATSGTAIDEAVATCVRSLSSGGKLFFCGNGGSAADAQHAASEFVGGFFSSTRPLPAIALTADTSVLTSIGNDYGYDQIFSRQLSTLASPGDVLFAMSTSGRSRNVIEAATTARKMGVPVIAMTGIHDSPLEELADTSLPICSAVSARVQEVHLLLLHVIAELVGRDLASRDLHPE